MACERPLGFGELLGGEITGAPEIPARDRAPGLPALGALLHDVGLGKQIGGDLLRGLELLEGKRKALAYAVVVDRQDVGTAEAEDEEHLDRPAADTADLGEVLDDGLIGHAAYPCQRRNRAVKSLRGQIAQCQTLVMREAGGAQLFIGTVEQVLGIGMGETLRLAEGLEAREQATMNGGSRLAVQLLIDDRFHESLKGRLRAGDPKREGTGAFDQLSQLWIACGEFPAGKSVEDAERAVDAACTPTYTIFFRSSADSGEPSLPRRKWLQRTAIRKTEQVCLVMSNAERLWLLVGPCACATTCRGERRGPIR